MRADGNCRSCNMPIRWARTAATGKPMPLDPDPAESGNITIERYEGTTPIVNVHATLEEVPRSEPLRYLSHFVTCKQASDWRKPKR